MRPVTGMCVRVVLCHKGSVEQKQKDRGLRFGGVVDNRWCEEEL